MKIKYDSNGQVIVAGEFVNLIGGVGETVEDYNGLESPETLIGKIKTKDGFREKTQQEKDADYNASPKKKLDELKKKNVLSLEEITEVLKLRGII